MGFDRLAPVYRSLEWFLAGNQLQQARIFHLQHCRDARSILLLGEGHGRFLEVLAKSNTDAEIIYVDQSEGMLQQARSSLRRSGLATSRVQFQQADIFHYQPSHPVDVLVTHFFLDCFRPDQLENLIPRLASMLNLAGRWLLADFQIPSGRIKACRARIVLALAYTFFKVATRLPARHICPPQPLLKSSRLTLQNRQTFNWDLLYSELWTNL